VEAVLDLAGIPATVGAGQPAGLTGREVEVLRLVAAGTTNKAIARQLQISPRTVQHHVAHIYDKIGVTSRAGAALFAAEHDLTGPGRPWRPTDRA
jgi:DNA-binding NarL/FixJ family response regulator